MKQAPPRAISSPLSVDSPTLPPDVVILQTVATPAPSPAVFNLQSGMPSFPTHLNFWTPAPVSGPVSAPATPDPQFGSLNGTPTETPQSLDQSAGGDMGTMNN